MYYVATSLDGYISGENGDITQFVQQGKGVDKYQADLLNFGTVIMGRKTVNLGISMAWYPDNRLIHI